MREDRAFAGIEERRIFENPDRGFDRIEAAAVCLKDAMPSLKRFGQLEVVFFLQLRRHFAPLHRARAAVNDEHGWPCGGLGFGHGR